MKKYGKYSGNQQEEILALKPYDKVSSGFFIHYPGVFSQLFAIFHLFLATLDQIVLWNIILDDDDYN